MAFVLLCIDTKYFLVHAKLTQSVEFTQLDVDIGVITA